MPGNAPSVRGLTERIRALQFPRIIADNRPFRTIIEGTPRTVNAGDESPFPSEPAIRHLDRGVRTVRDDINFEHLLHAVEVLEPYVAARTFLSELSEVRPVLTAFTDPTPRYTGLMNWHLLVQLRWDMIRVVRNFVLSGTATPPPRFQQDSDAVMRVLRDAFTMHVFNLNYDDLLERSLHWYDGFDSRAPEWSAFDRTGYANALGSHTHHMMTHLHGSVRFGYITGKPSPVITQRQHRQIVKYSTADAATTTLLQPPEPLYTDDIIDDPAPIISGANKVLKFTSPPYSYYYSALQQVLQRSSRILCIGYGFGDPHVNNWIGEAIAHHGEDRIRMAVIDLREHTGEWVLDTRSGFSEVRDRLSRGPLELDDIGSREFASSGGICLTLGGYPPRSDIARRIVRFLLEDQ